MHSAKNEPFGRTFPSPDSLLYQIRRIFSEHINILCIEDNAPMCSLLCEDYFRSPILNKKIVPTFDSAKGAILSETPYHFWILDLTLDHDVLGRKSPIKGDGVKKAKGVLIGSDNIKTKKIVTVK